MKQHKFYTNSESAWTAMLLAIKNANESIYLETYVFVDDTGPNFDFIQALSDKARAGVKVVFILDGFGGIYLSRSAIDKLRSAGADIRFFNSWFRRIHRKILIIDEEVAFLGGVSVGEKYHKWQDLHLMLNYRVVVKDLVRSFSRSYFFCGGNDEKLLAMREESKIRKTRLWLLEHFPWTGKLMLRSYYEEKIALAQNRVAIVSPYFVPHGWLIKALGLAIARGVAIDVIIPRHSDSGMSFANYVFASELSEAGIKFYLTKDMIHAKAILVDDRVALVGSQNIDALSFDWNAEAGVSFEEREMIRDLKNIIDVWKMDAIPLKYEPNMETWYHRIAAKIIRLIQPIL